MDCLVYNFCEHVFVMAISSNRMCKINYQKTRKYFRALLVEFILIQYEIENSGYKKRKQKSLEVVGFPMISAGIENNSLNDRIEIWRQSLTFPADMYLFQS